MNQKKKTKLTKYIVCFCIASLITVGVFWRFGFFTDSTAVNLQILADGFTISGILFLLFAGMMFVSGEGALIGIGFVVKNIIQWFVPGGRMKHELYKDYRERKMNEKKKSGDHCILLTGLLFFAIGIIFLVILYTNYYSMPQ